MRLTLTSLSPFLVLPAFFGKMMRRLRYSLSLCMLVCSPSSDRLCRRWSTGIPTVRANLRLRPASCTQHSEEGRTDLHVDCTCPAHRWAGQVKIRQSRAGSGNETSATPKAPPSVPGTRVRSPSTGACPRTFSSSKVKPLPARTRLLYLKVWQCTTGRTHPSAGRGAIAAAFFCRAMRLLFFLPGWLNHVLTYLSQCFLK